MMSTAQDDFAPSIRWWVIWLVFIPSWMIIGLAVELADLALSSTFSGFADQWYTRNFVLQNLINAPRVTRYNKGTNMYRINMWRHKTNVTYKMK